MPGSPCSTRCSRKNERHIESISKALKKAKALYLATDPDREGEAISWHLSEILKERGDLAHKKMHRVVFYEITKSAVREAISQPRDLSFDLVNAQQARRALDYLVGFNLSPLLWKKVRRGLSAGRVQSPALRMICEREEEILAFVPQEYWTLDGEGEHSAKRFPLKLTEYQGHEGRAVQLYEHGLPRATSRRRSSTRRAPRAPSGESLGTLVVSSIDRKERRRNPAPPFTTSTLQQEAARKLGFNARRTMRLAQQLYEGVDIGEGAVGLITYMRTDSVNSRGRSRARDPRSRRAPLRQGRSGRRAARLQDEVEERAGSARSHSPDVRRHRARGHREQARPGSVPALFAHLEARRRFPDEPRRVRHGRRRHARGPGWAAASHAARERLHAREARLTCPCTRKARTT